MSRRATPSPEPDPVDWTGITEPPWVLGVRIRSRSRDAQWDTVEIICPWCSKTHRHGLELVGDPRLLNPRNGHKVAHCADKSYERNHLGYYVYVDEPRLVLVEGDPKRDAGTGDA